MKIGISRRRARLGPSKVEQARIRAARKNPHWTELDPQDLVERGHLFVSVETDQIYAPTRGVIWEPHTARAIADFAPLRFTVDDNKLRFFEQQPETWSDRIARQARRAS